MTDYTDPQRSSERLSDTDRQEAVDRLSAARDEGRLRPDEFDTRASAARLAVTRGDLRPLFEDLPASPGSAAPATFAPPASSMAAAPGSYSSPPPVERGGGALGGAVGATIMALMPFIALALFFLVGFAGGWTWSWLFFLLIPVAGLIIYGPGTRYRR